MTQENLSESNRHKPGTRPARTATASSQFPVWLVNSEEKPQKKLSRSSRPDLFSLLRFLPPLKMAESHFKFKKTFSSGSARSLNHYFITLQNGAL
jgi:hypothetical protein